jgi:hypothetical protein
VTELHEKHFIRAPFVRARAHLHETIEDAMRAHKPQLTKLSVSYPGGEISKNVLVTYRKAIDPMHFDEPWDVHWTPEGGGPYPDFDGALTVRADENYTSAILELDGAYRPPLGAAGAVFDAVLGSKIASITAQTLLASIAAEIEQRYRREEDAKPANG